MNVNKKNACLTNGWILCPSKSFPGKFYYFNVLNGEAAWSLNEADKKDLRKDTSIQKIADKCHNYPEPTTLPDDNTMTSCNIGSTSKNPDFLKNIPCTQQLPTFGQAAFPKYVGNVEPLMSNILWTPIQLPMPMFCPDTKRPMFDKVTQTSELERELFIQSCDIPLCKRFKNYEKLSLSFDKRNKIVNRPTSFETSTPRGANFENVNSPSIPNSKSLIKEPVLKFENKLLRPKTPEVLKGDVKSTLRVGNKVESTNAKMSSVGQQVDSLQSLDHSDLRFLLLAKRRKSVDATVDPVVERKKPKISEVSHVTPKKKVTFDLDTETDGDTNVSDAQEDFIPLTSNPKTITIDTPKATLHLKDKTPSINIEQIHRDTPRAMASPYTKTNILLSSSNSWYIVVDTDVLLLDYEFIDQLVLSDAKCKLVIPHAVRVDIEGLCIGDCRGQQRVINARQLTRRLATPPPHYIVESEPDNSDIVVTTESILNCCLRALERNCYVVLITNDPHLQTRANILNITSYRLNEIKNGVNIKPEMTSEHKKIKISTPYNDNNIIFQNNLSLFNNNDSYSTINTVKKQLFSTCDKDIGNKLDCDKLINITKPKNLKNSDKYDSDSTTSDISREVQNLNLKDKSVLKTQNGNSNPFPSQNFDKEDEIVNFEKKKQNFKTVFSAFDFKRTVPNAKRELDFEKSVHNFEKEIPKQNPSNTEKLFCSIPISDMKQFKIQNSNPKTSLECSGIDNKNPKMSLRHEPYGIENRPQNAAQSRINKIFSTINCDSTKTQLKNQAQNDSTGVFKIPQPLIKNRTRNTSAHLENSSANDIFRTRGFKSLDSIDENLKRFCVRSKIMSDKINTRIDEWICTFNQIIEDVLNGLLRKNSVCMKDTVPPLTLHETLNYIKMLYDRHTTVRELINKLSILMDKCINIKGTLKTVVTSSEFMKMLGYGVLLVLSLQNILPLSEELVDAESQLSVLLYNIESNTKELDPELLKPPAVSRSDVDTRNEEIRPNFLKDSSYVLDYLKKHFKEWSSYKEELNEQNYNKFEILPDFKVVRTFGKNLNLLKIDRSKAISLTKNTTENDTANQRTDEPKIIRLLENDQLTKSNSKVNTENSKDEAGPKLMKLFKDQNTVLNNNIENQPFTKDSQNKTIQNNDASKMMKQTDNIDEKRNIKAKTIEDLNFSSHENTFTQICETAGPKMIRNIKLIDEYEKKIKNREPLDLDLLDYSEIYEPSVAENLDFDVITENQNNLENNNTNFDNNNYGLTNTEFALEDFTEDVQLSDDNNFYASPAFNYQTNQNPNNLTKNEPYSTSNNDSFQSKTTNCSTIYTENLTSRNDSGINNEISDNHNDVSCNDKSVSCYDKTACHHDKIAYVVGDDTTNDSGFENDSTYAHSVVKIFLNELSTSFKVIYTFVKNFVDEIRFKDLSEIRKNILHCQASKSLEDMAAIIDRLRSIIKRESAEETVLKTLLLKAGVEATTDKRMTKYRQIVRKSLEQARILENALKIIVSTTVGDFDAISTNADSINSSIRYFNIFE